MSLSDTYALKPIGLVHSCFKEKFGIPRQPGLAPAATAVLELLPPYNRPEAVEGLSEASHIWVQFIFHQSVTNEWKPTVRPPRLGGNKRLGVFATRSPVRPNALGLSVVKLEGIDTANGQVRLQLSGIDLVDGTPVVDIKPYVPYVDVVPEAENAFADQAPEFLHVEIPASIQAQCEEYRQTQGVDMAALITQVLRQDPRPQYQTPDPERVYGMKLLDADLRWQYVLKDDQWQIVVLALESLSTG